MDTAAIVSLRSLTALVFFYISLVAFEESIRVHSCPFVVPWLPVCFVVNPCLCHSCPFVSIRGSEFFRVFRVFRGSSPPSPLPTAIRGSWTSLVKTAKARDVEAAEDGSTSMRG